MAKRFQIFVSSTFKDLKTQRALVIKHIHDMGHFPVGMEIFPASDQTQWDYIKSIIDQSDYYVLILGGCYGSTDSDGLSFTEKEYNYAVERGIHVLVLFRENIGDLPVGLRDDDLANINCFRATAMQSRLARSWTSESDLIAGVLISLQQAVERSPAIGWVRGDEVLSASDQQTVNVAIAENAKLRAEIEKLRKCNALSNYDGIAGLDESYTIVVEGLADSEWSFSWRELWDIYGGGLTRLTRSRGLEFVPRRHVEQAADEKLEEICTGGDMNFGSVRDSDFETIEAQFIAYGFIRVDSNGHWVLTEKGKTELVAARIVRTSEGA